MRSHDSFFQMKEGIPTLGYKASEESIESCGYLRKFAAKFVKISVLRKRGYVELFREKIGVMETSLKCLFNNLFNHN
jgi:hypothetical protein